MVQVSAAMTNAGATDEVPCPVDCRIHQLHPHNLSHPAAAETIDSAMLAGRLHLQKKRNTDQEALVARWLDEEAKKNPWFHCQLERVQDGLRF